MLKTVKFVVAVALTVSLSTSAFAGTLGKGSVFSNPSKVSSTDLNHDELGGAAQEDTTIVDISGIATGGTDDGINETLAAGLTGGVDTVVTGIGWDVNLDAFDPSWLSEATISFVDGGVTLAPGTGDDAPGLGVNYNSGGIVDLTAIPDGYGGYLDLSFTAPGGVLNLEFFESFDDAATSPDGMWLAGSALTIEHSPVPEPAAFGMMAVLALGLLAFRRK